MDRDGRRRRRPLDIDLNNLPPEDDDDHDDALRTLTMYLQSIRRAHFSVERGNFTLPDSEDFSFRWRHQRRRVQIETQEPIVIGGQGSSFSLTESVTPPPPPPPSSSSFICPICFDPLVNETATKCGHVFCQHCIGSTFKEQETNQRTNQQRCPICRDKLTQQDLIRVYFPVGAPPPQQLPTFPCPICLGQVVDATATNCGHIFCEGCIQQLAAVDRPECPKCRQIVSHQDLFRIYIP